MSPNAQYLVLGSGLAAVLVLDMRSDKIKIVEIYDDEHSSAVVGSAWQPMQNKECGFVTTDTTGGLYFWKWMS